MVVQGHTQYHTASTQQVGCCHHSPRVQTRNKIACKAPIETLLIGFFHKTQPRLLTGASCLLASFCAQNSIKTLYRESTKLLYSIPIYIHTTPCTREPTDFGPYTFQVVNVFISCFLPSLKKCLIAYTRKTKQAAAQSAFDFFCPHCLFLLIKRKLASRTHRESNVPNNKTNHTSVSLPSLDH